LTVKLAFAGVFLTGGSRSDRFTGCGPGEIPLFAGKLSGGTTGAGPPPVIDRPGRRAPPVTNFLRPLVSIHAA
jgi:hypothetical protein